MFAVILVLGFAFVDQAMDHNKFYNKPQEQVQSQVMVVDNCGGEIVLNPAKEVSDWDLQMMAENCDGLPR